MENENRKPEPFGVPELAGMTPHDIDNSIRALEAERLSRRVAELNGTTPVFPVGCELTVDCPTEQRREPPTLKPGVFGGIETALPWAELWYEDKGAAAMWSLLPDAQDASDLGNTAAEVNELSYMCHALSYAAGWWHDPETGDPIGSVPEKMMLIVSEVSEAMEGDRRGEMDDKLPLRPAVEVELADAMIRIFDLAGALGLDLGGALIEKLKYNVDRADHKAKNRANGGKAY